MTNKQERFVAEVVAGASLSAAYREAYDAEGMSDGAVRVEACRLARNPNIALMIDEGRRAALGDAIWSRQRAVARLVAVNDASLAVIEAGDLKAPVLSAFLGSLDRLCKLYGIDRHTSDADQHWADTISSMFSDISVSL